MSLYIPRVFTNISKERIMETFDGKLGIGKVSHVDLVAKEGKHGDYYNSAYIHFEYWYNNSHAFNIQEKIRTGKETRIVYDDPWYWIVLENHGTKMLPNQRKPCINLTGLDSPKTHDTDESYESYDLVDAEYATQLEDLVADLRMQLAGVMKESIFREKMLHDEIDSLTNKLSYFEDVAEMV